MIRPQCVAHYEHFEDKTVYSAVMALRYINKWSQYGELLKQAAAHEEDALASRTPLPHAYAVVPVATETTQE